MRDVAIIAARALRGRLASPRADGERPLGVSPVNCERILAEVYGVEVVDVDDIPGGVPGGYVAEMTTDPPMVRLSTRWSRLCRSWTLAHEIGHLELDRPIDRVHRDPPGALEGTLDVGSGKERRANRFARAFLLPPDEVRSAFVTAFGVPRLSLRDVSDAVSAEFSYSSGVRREWASGARFDVESLARCCAAATIWQGRFFGALRTQFGVSLAVMANTLRSYGIVGGDIT